MGINPWRSQLQLWNEKVHGIEQPMNDAMRRGQEMELDARKAYEFMSGNEVMPMVAEHDLWEFVSASFDGISSDFAKGVEIKCGAKSFNQAKDGVIPPYYFAQMQHQMLVSDLKVIDYFCFNGKEGILLKQERDDNFISNLIDRYCSFWHHVLSKTEPGNPYETTNAF
jgi:putative phage-type endonuclease